MKRPKKNSRTYNRKIECGDFWERTMDIEITEAILKGNDNNEANGKKNKLYLIPSCDDCLFKRYCPELIEIMQNRLYSINNNADIDRYIDILVNIQDSIKRNKVNKYIRNFLGKP